MLRDTGYAREIASADIDGQRIERLHVKNTDDEEIRFSWWKDGRMAMRPLDLPERHLLPLMQKAIKAGVFSASFLKDLRALLTDQQGGG